MRNERRTSALITPTRIWPKPTAVAACAQVTPVATPSADPVPFRTLPGGALISERWSAPERVIVSICGEIDEFDQHALLNLLTGCILDGARHIVIDARVVTFADVAVLRAIDQARRHLARPQGSPLRVLGLGHLENAVRSIPHQQLS